MYLEPDFTVDRYRAFNYEVINAFGRVKVKITRPASGVQHLVGVEVVENSLGHVENFLDTVQPVASGAWKKVVVSVRSTLVDGLHDIRVFTSGTFSEQRTGLSGYS